MFSYYGSKANVVRLYPKPKHGLVIEPFAGSARYALEHFDNDVLLVDKYAVVVKIWKWLQQCAESDILSLPELRAGQTLDDFTFDCEEAKLLMGFIVQYGVASPGKVPSAIKINPGTNSRGNFMKFSKERIAKNLFKIKHWQIVHGSYTEIGNRRATWFIDPPYQVGGHKYRESNKKIDYELLSLWCRDRVGQVIVCENEKAKWLPFAAFKTQQSQKGLQRETYWLDEPMTIQSTLFEEINQTHPL